MICRDEYGIILQAPLDENSGDDSLCRTSIYALSGDIESQKAMWNWRRFSGFPPRHPTMEPSCHYFGINGDRWTTKDQITPYVAWLYEIKEYFLAERIRDFHLFTVNSDPLPPDLKWMFAKAANHWSQYPWVIIGAPWTIISILWSCFITPKHELNQLFCQCSVAGKWAVKLVCKLHPDWEKNILDYYGANPGSHGSWRGCAEIGIAFVSKIKEWIK